MTVKINSLEVENVKRVKAVQLKPTKNGLTIIGGRNGQGKTSVLDAIAWALGGNKMTPSKAKRDGSVSDPKLHIELSNGIIVERSGKNSALKVLDPTGKKSGQKLLDGLIEKMALNLPAFMQATPAEKGKTLLQIVGVGDELIKLEQEEATLYSRRTEIGRIADQKKKFADEMKFYPDVPNEPVSAAELIQQQQEILKRNAENQRKRENVEHIQRQQDEALAKRDELKKQMEELELEIARLGDDLSTAKKSALDLLDESTEELEKNIADIDTLNQKIRANLDREKAEIDAEGFRKQYSQLTQDIDEIRKAKKSLLDGAQLPLEGLAVEQGELVYNGQKWDCMSGSEQLKVATAIVRKLNPECGFVLMDKLEQMDVDTLKEFGAWLEAEGLQVIATRVSTGDECSIIIEEGYVKGGNQPKDEQPEEPINETQEAPAPTWGSWSK